MRTADALITEEDDAWPGVAALIENSELPVEVLPGDPAQGRATLEKLQVSTASVLGAVAYHTGGLLIDHGWTRLLGGTASRGLPGIAEASGLTSPEYTVSTGPSLLVGWDVLGGAIMVNGAAPVVPGREGGPGSVEHLSVDFLDWSGVGERNWPYSTYLAYLLHPLSREMNEFDRWPGWEAEVAAVPPDRGLSVYPFPWTEEGRDDIAATSRRPVPITELLGTHRDFAHQHGLPDLGPLGALA